jgi:sodium/hydrogen antiporter
MTAMPSGTFVLLLLVSIVLGLVYLERDRHLAGEEITRLAVMATVLLSIFAHGMSAMPGIGVYERALGPAGAAQRDQQG